MSPRRLVSPCEEDKSRPMRRRDSCAGLRAPREVDLVGSYGSWRRAGAAVRTDGGRREEEAERADKLLPKACLLLMNG